MTMLMLLFILLACPCVVVLGANNNDRFNYRETLGSDFGPEDWNQVTCDDPSKCVSSDRAMLSTVIIL